MIKKLRCPLCRHPLLSNAQGLACANRHQFDRAKEGYFNLLPVQNKHSLEPGDAKEQLQARRLFLQAGFFASLKTRLQELMPAAAEAVLDIGCGDGYFTSGFADALPNAQIFGIDIAKAGVRMAAKAAKGNSSLTFCVSSSFDLPFFDESIDLITRIYAPSKDSELWRVIKPGGKLIIVAPGENHLLGLRSRLYKEVRSHQQLVAPTGFSLVEQHRLTEELRLNEAHHCAALLAMTPFAWKLTAELYETLLADQLQDTLDFVISIYSKEA
ncbi:MAG TPA: methyltransferase domain-containing protein [Cellvibrio sp.]|nr:methyltransferase domain-containing protein [Cellvibrio sp.]